ncbi:hypothetical protein QOZ80_7BG0608640 [Eleusine coracana subsp. coracana]|nr:hypothetical protein QOZ80_7BG0608640 [Eleusine coracana subsp. coracana]
MDWFQLPAPIFSFQATAAPSRYKVDVFPLTDRKVLINHESGGTLLFDVDTCRLVTMPNLHRHKGGMTISLFVPSAGAGGGGSLYIMERIPRPELGSSTLSDQFEALVYSSPTMNSLCESAYCQRFPPPPFICEPDYHYPYPRITAYAAVGSDVYISAERAGTYCLDTRSNTWDRVGQWTLPFQGKAEYEPELNLWFGLSAEHGHIAAADLSDMSSQPQLVDTGSSKELELPDEWLVSYDSRLVNLGSGRFCIARFFYTLLMHGDSVAEVNQILVLTGVEVTSPVHDGNRTGSCTREVKLAIRQHKSKCHISDCISIVDVF